MIFNPIVSGGAKQSASVNLVEFGGTGQLDCYYTNSEGEIITGAQVPSTIHVLPNTVFVFLSSVMGDSVGQAELITTHAEFTAYAVYGDAEISPSVGSPG